MGSYPPGNLNKKRPNTRFNPCFSGLWVLTHFMTLYTSYLQCCFNPCFSGLWVLTRNIKNIENLRNQGFNPCFSGLWVLTSNFGRYVNR